MDPIIINNIASKKEYDFSGKSEKFMFDIFFCDLLLFIKYRFNEFGLEI